MFGDWWLEVFANKPAHLRFILEMARYANAEGEVRVSACTVAARMRTTERHAREYRAAAVKAGVVTKIGNHGRGQAAVYRLNYSKPADHGQGHKLESMSTVGMPAAGRDNALNRPAVAVNPAERSRSTLPNVVPRNGMHNGSYNGMHAACVLKSDEANDVVAALSALGVDGKVAAKLAVEYSDVAATFVDFDVRDYPDADNPAAIIVSEIRKGNRCRSGRSPYKGLQTFRSEDCGCGLGRFECHRLHAQHNTTTDTLPTIAELEEPPNESPW
jgi:hypothetical protein